MLILGTLEIGYLRDLDENVRLERIQGILTPKTPAIIIAGRYSPPREITRYCEQNALPLFRTKMKTIDCLTRVTYSLQEEFSPGMTCHGTLVEAFGVGVLIQK